MPRAEIATKQAKFTLEQLHAELGGKLLANQAEALRLRKAMKHVEAVLKLLDPSYSLRGIAVRRRKRGGDEIMARAQFDAGPTWAQNRISARQKNK